ncbi:hypothetical protein KXE51_003556 [Salmonella enterica]|nr:hypothetical protein [Salmonella enterica]
MDITPLLHALCAVSIQCGFGIMTGNWGLGGIIGCMWFIAREHTQAEYRWISQFGGGKRANMPWWGGFDYRAWNLSSMLDWLVPVMACAVVHFVSVKFT